MLRSSFQVIFTLLAASMMLACVSNSPKTGSTNTALPDWVTLPPQESGMAYGVGSVELYDNPDQAIKLATDYARADLVSRLKVNINSTTTSSIIESSLNGATELQKEFSQSVSSSIPKTELDEVVISDTYTDSKYAYVLVELDRKATGARLSRQMNEVEMDISRLMEQPIQSTTTLGKIQQQLPALKLFAQHDQLAQKYAFISTRRMASPLSDEMKDYRASILSGLKQLKVNLKLTTPDAQKTKSSLIEALTEQGINLGEFEQPDLIFQLATQLQTIEEEGRNYVFANAQINIHDGQGTILSAFSKKARGVSGIEQNAIYKASENLGKAISEELAETLAQRL